MNQKASQITQRRQFLKWIGGSAALLGVGGLTACSDNGSGPAAGKPAQASKPEPTPEPAPAPEPVAEPLAEPLAEPVAEPAPEPISEAPPEAVAEATPETAAPQAGDGVPRLAEDHPQAQALGYRNDSSAVDAAKYPTHAPDQACANCTLFAAAAGQDWGPCGIFPGHEVNARGWCSAYSRKA